MLQFLLDDDRTLFEDSFRFAQHQVRELIHRYPDFYPMYTQNGRWKHEGPAWTNWCDGFLPGMMWIFERRAMQENGGPSAWRELAIRYSKPLEPRKQDKDAQDLGFIFLSTYHRWFKLTKEPALNDVLIEAGRTLAQRFQEKGGYLRSFISPDSLFIDIMMNVGIVFYAAAETGDRKLRDIALRHCLTTRRYLVRGDGSTAHEGIFDTETGELLRQSTQQGYRGDSCWSRGLAWAMYGFTVAFEYTRDPRFLQTAEACATFFLATRTPMAYRRGISTRPRITASSWTHRRRRSPRRRFCVCERPRRTGCARKRRSAAAAIAAADVSRSWRLCAGALKSTHVLMA